MDSFYCFGSRILYREYREFLVYVWQLFLFGGMPRVFYSLF